MHVKRERPGGPIDPRIGELETGRQLGGLVLNHAELGRVGGGQGVAEIILHIGQHPQFVGGRSQRIEDELHLAGRGVVEGGGDRHRQARGHVGDLVIGRIGDRAGIGEQSEEHR